MNTQIQKPIMIFLFNLMAFIIAYYVSILLHEWGHGTIAWLNGIKHSPFDIHYGGWLLLTVDENVNYAKLMLSNKPIAAGLIGIAGTTVSLILATLSLILLNLKKIQKSNSLFIISYWFLIINMIPLVQYLSLSVFSPGGDMGRFIHGLDISPWLVFIPGTIFIILMLTRILRVEIIKAYRLIPIKSLWGERILLLATLSVIFLLLYTHDYNPIADNRGVLIDQILAIFSIALVPILFLICNPSRTWVKDKIALQMNNLKAN